MKGGYGFQRTVNDIDSLYPGGYVEHLLGQLVRVRRRQHAARGTYGYYEVNDRRITNKAGNNIHSLYVQDQWTVGNRLTLNLGLRTENEKVPTFRPDYLETAFQFGFGDKLAPRLGAAYDLKGDGTREGVRQLGPVLRLDEVRAAARLVRRRDVVHLLPRARTT